MTLMKDSMRPLIVIPLCALLACKGKQEAPPSAKPAEPAMVPETTEMPAPGTTASGINLAGLNGELKKEAEHRPKSVVTVEQVLDALEKQGFKAEQKQQLLALSGAASYCADARVGGGVIVVICEYESPEHATRGRQAIEKRYAAGSKDTIRKINGATMLTVVSPDPAQAKRVDQIVSTFAALSPSSGS
jgi:hypothetical protein